MPSARLIRRGCALKCRLAVNGIQNASRSFGATCSRVSMRCLQREAALSERRAGAVNGRPVPATASPRRPCGSNLRQPRVPGAAMYSETTRSIRITVEPFYVADQSEPEKARWVFGYRVKIQNEGPETVQLITRHWKITDGRGRVVEVKGEGVVGEQPLLEP